MHQHYFSTPDPSKKLHRIFRGRLASLVSELFFSFACLAWTYFLPNSLPVFALHPSRSDFRCPPIPGGMHMQDFELSTLFAANCLGGFLPVSSFLEPRCQWVTSRVRPRRAGVGLKPTRPTRGTEAFQSRNMKWAAGRFSVFSPSLVVPR